MALQKSEPEAATQEHSRASVRDNKGFKVVRALTVDRPIDELFKFWRDLENLPKFMSHLESVKILDEKRSHWVSRGPGGRTFQWDAEIINEHANELIAWRSCDGADLAHAGTVRFHAGPQGRGTEVRVAFEYVPPAGVLGNVVAKWLGEDPAHQIADDLRRFKALMEAGEIPTIEGQSCGSSQ